MQSIVCEQDMTILPSAPLPCYTPRMKKWFKEDFEWEIEVTAFCAGARPRSTAATVLRRPPKFLLNRQRQNAAH